MKVMFRLAGDNGEGYSWPEEMLSYPLTYRWETMEWRELEPFAAGMRVVGYERGRSAVRLVLVDQATQIKYPMFISDATDMITTCDLHKGLTFNVWEPVKKGSNYGIRIAR